jgi:hypothetical protein
MPTLAVNGLVATLVEPVALIGSGEFTWTGFASAPRTG